MYANIYLLVLNLLLHAQTEGFLHTLKLKLKRWTSLFKNKEILEQLSGQSRNDQYIKQTRINFIAGCTTHFYLGTWLNFA